MGADMFLAIFVRTNVFLYQTSPDSAILTVLGYMHLRGLKLRMHDITDGDPIPAL